MAHSLRHPSFRSLLGFHGHDHLRSNCASIKRVLWWQRLGRRLSNCTRKLFSFYPTTIMWRLTFRFSCHPSLRILLTVLRRTRLTLELSVGHIVDLQLLSHPLHALLSAGSASTPCVGADSRPLRMGPRYPSNRLFDRSGLVLVVATRGARVPG